MTLPETGYVRATSSLPPTRSTSHTRCSDMSNTTRRPLPLSLGTPEELVSPGAAPVCSPDASRRAPAVGVGVMVCAGDGLLVGVGVVVAAPAPAPAPAPGPEPVLGALLDRTAALDLEAGCGCAEAEPDGQDAEATQSRHQRDDPGRAGSGHPPIPRPHRRVGSPPGLRGRWHAPHRSRRRPGVPRSHAVTGVTGVTSVRGRFAARPRARARRRSAGGEGGGHLAVRLRARVARVVARIDRPAAGASAKRIDFGIGGERTSRS